MRAHLASMLSLALLVSCGTTKTVVTGYARGGLPLGTFETNNFFYGKLNADSTLFGVTHSSNLDIGFKNLQQGMATLAGAIYYGRVQIAKETTAQLANQGLTQTQIAQINASLQESIAAKGYDTTLAGIKAGLFVPAGTTFKQP